MAKRKKIRFAGVNIPIEPEGFCYLGSRILSSETNASTGEVLDCKTGFCLADELS
jgi:hypothetical protein